MLMPAIENVKRMSKSRLAVMMMLLRERNSVFNKALSPSSVFTILKSLETLMMRKAVTLKFKF